MISEFGYQIVFSCTMFVRVYDFVGCHYGLDVILVALLDLSTVVVSFVGQDCQILTIQPLFSFQSDVMEGVSIISVDHVGTYHEIVFVIHGSLYIVGHFDHLSLNEQCFGVGIRGADLGFSALLELLLEELVVDFVVLEVPEFFLNELDLPLCEFLGICPVKLLEVFFGLLLDIAEMPVDFALAVIILLAVGGPELGTVDSDCLSADQTRFFEEQHIELEAVFECFGIILPEIGNGVVVGSESVEQPSDFDVAPTFPFEPSAAADAVEVAIEVKFEQYFGMI